MKAQMIFFAAALLIPSVAVSQDISKVARHGADDPAGHDSNDDANHEVNHSPTTHPSTPASSASSHLKIERRIKLKHRALQRDEFTAQAKIPVPLVDAGIINVPDADAADVQIDLARAGTTFATCRLTLTELDEEHRSVRAEYKVDLRTEVKKGVASTRVKRGSCDTDLSTPGDENTVPAIQRGDTVQLFVNGVAVPTVLSLKVR